MHSSNILNFHSKHIQVLRIECDSSMATEQTTENTRASGRTTGGTTSTDLPTRNLVTTNALNCDDDNVEAASK